MSRTFRKSYNGSVHRDGMDKPRCDCEWRKFRTDGYYDIKTGMKDKDREEEVD